jgi:hypothetical protein
MWQQKRSKSIAMNVRTWEVHKWLILPTKCNLFKYRCQAYIQNKSITDNIYGFNIIFQIVAKVSLHVTDGIILPFNGFAKPKSII